MDPLNSQEHLTDVVEPTDEELAAAESPLEEWDELRVQRFWSAMVAEELGTDEPEVDDLEEAPARRTSSGAVLRIVGAPSEPSRGLSNGESTAA